MPTAAKLVSFVLFAALGFALAEVFKTATPDRTQFGVLSPVCALIGGFCGWIVMGPLAGRGMSAAWGFGVRTAITTVVFALLGWSLYEMILRSTRGGYSGSPMEALTGAVTLILQNGGLMLTPGFLGTMVIGGALAGIVVEWSGRRWT